MLHICIWAGVGFSVILCVASWDLVPWPRIEPAIPALEVWHVNHWATWASGDFKKLSAWFLWYLKGKKSSIILPGENATSVILKIVKIMAILYLLSRTILKSLAGGSDGFVNIWVHLTLWLCQFHRYPHQHRLTPSVMMGLACNNIIVYEMDDHGTSRRCVSSFAKWQMQKQNPSEYASPVFDLFLHSTRIY